jgi:ribosomal protein S8
MNNYKYSESNVYNLRKIQSYITANKYIIKYFINAIILLFLTMMYLLISECVEASGDGILNIKVAPNFGVINKQNDFITVQQIEQKLKQEIKNGSYRKIIFELQEGVSYINETIKIHNINLGKNSKKNVEVIIKNEKNKIAVISGLKKISNEEVELVTDRRLMSHFGNSKDLDIYRVRLPSELVKKITFPIGKSLVNKKHFLMPEFILNDKKLTISELIKLQ